MENRIASITVLKDADGDAEGVRIDFFVPPDQLPDGYMRFIAQKILDLMKIE